MIVTGAIPAGIGGLWIAPISNGAGFDSYVPFTSPGVPLTNGDARHAAPYSFGSSGLTNSSDGPSPSAVGAQSPASL